MLTNYHSSSSSAAASCRYADGLESGILANANAGGENVARGSMLGALLGIDFMTDDCIYYMYNYETIFYAVWCLYTTCYYVSISINAAIYREMYDTIVSAITELITISFFMIGTGAQHGLEAFPSWTHALKDKAQIDAELDSFVN